MKANPKLDFQIQKFQKTLHEKRILLQNFEFLDFPIHIAALNLRPSNNCHQHLDLVAKIDVVVHFHPLGPFTFTDPPC